MYISLFKVPVPRLALPFMVLNPQSPPLGARITATKTGLSEDDLGRVYELLFVVLLLIEDLGGLQAEDDRFLATLVFAQMPEPFDGFRGPESAETLIATNDRSQFHGGLDDAAIQAVAIRLAGY